MAPNYFDYVAKLNGQVPVEVVEWTCPEPVADDSYVVRELTEQEWCDFVARLRKAGL